MWRDRVALVTDKHVHISVTFLGLLRDQMGTRRLELDLPRGTQLADLQDVLVPEVEDKLADWAWDRERQCFTSRVTMARGQSEGDDEAALSDGEEIIVFALMAGG